MRLIKYTFLRLQFYSIVLFELLKPEKLDEIKRREKKCFQVLCWSKKHEID